MLTKNFYNVLFSFGSNVSIRDCIKDQTGTSRDSYVSATSGNTPSFFTYAHSLVTTLPNSGGGTMIGTGKTPATADDYNLESPIVSGIEIINQSKISYNITDDGIDVSATYGIRNTSGEAIEISEIGCFGRAQYQNSSSNQYKAFLVERTVLETPVVIPAGESRQITYTISLRYPTA